MPQSLPSLIASQLRESSRTLAATARIAPRIAQAAELFLAAYRRGGKALIFGNGGSAADAQHFSTELVGRFLRDRPALPALALTVNTSTLTAIANDFGYAESFARQLRALARPGDVAVAISTSGNSPNILKAVAAARKLGLSTVGLAGADGGKLKAAVDVCICAPAASTPHVQEAHIAIIHAWCGIIESAMSGEPCR
jgi:D-sedoheptulose 7-phosphate isomerase